MARSEDALRRRAEKRQRSLEEQKKIDMEEMRKREKLEHEKNMLSSNQQRPPNGDPRFHAPRNNYSNDKDDSRPPSSKKQRHDPETSKALVWAQQADDEKLSKNQALRRKYHETNGGIGMDPEELERAKLLIARDERKKQKKQMKKQKKESEESAGVGEEGEEETKNEQDEDNKVSSEEGVDKNKSNEEGSAKDENDSDGAKGNKPCKEDHDAKSKKNAKAKRDRNRALRSRFQETAGKGMSKEDIRRAKQLLERDERKKEKRAALEKQ